MPEVKLIHKIDTENEGIAFLQCGKGIYRVQVEDDQTHLHRLDRSSEPYNWDDRAIFSIMGDKLEDGIALAKLLIVEIEDNPECKI